MQGTQFLAGREDLRGRLHRLCLRGRAVANIRAWLKPVAAQAGQVAGAIMLAAVLLSGAIGLHACASSPAQTVAQAEAGYTALANLAAGYCESAGHDAAVCKTARELNAAIDVKGADGQRHGALIAARAAAESGDAQAATAANTTLQAAIAALAGFEGAHGLKK